MTLSPLDRPCGEILTPCYLALPRGYEPDLFFDGDRFLAHLEKTFHSFDVATYSTSKAYFSGSPLRRIDRLIVGLKESGSVVQAKRIKYVPNNHVKLFLCYNKKDCLKAVFIGSQNLTYGTNLNLMYRVRKEHSRPLLAYFNSMWNAK